MRSTSSTVLSTSVETLEALRRKEKDVREDEIKTMKKLEEIEKDIHLQREKLEEERQQFEQQKSLHEVEAFHLKYSEIFSKSKRGNKFTLKRSGQL